MNKPASLFKTGNLLVLLFLVLLLLGCATFGILDQPAEDEAQPSGSASSSVSLDVAPTVMPTFTPVATSRPEADTDSNVENSPTPAGSASDSLNNPVKPEPEMGEITFALGVTEDFEPVDADIFFTHGITEVHAIFEYSGISPDTTWERVWYLNDKEVARLTEKWAGPEAGIFDYFIDNSGRPLPAGDWLLELYVEGELKGLGVFIIDQPETDQSQGATGVSLLAYTKCDGDHHNIYVADTNGNNEQLIVTRGAGPSWAPGGGIMFFYGEGGVDRQIRDGIEYVFDGISNGVVAVRTSPLPTSIQQLNLFQFIEWKQGSARWANVSPDGTMVAFDANPGGDYRIYFLGTEENQQYRYEIIGEQADWSPNSQKIVYRSGRDGQTGIWISNRDDSGHTRITGGGSDSFPAWSPDGRTIAFSRDEGGNVDIYVVNTDGSTLRRLTTAPGHDTLPVYTPNGEIIFRSARTGSWGVWKMDADGSNQREIIPNACVGNDWAYSKMDVLQ